MFRTLLSRFLATLRPERHERRLHEEIETHLDELAARESSHQSNEQDARRAARRAFGSVELAKEQWRDQARLRPLENFLRDVRFALRQYRKHPAFTLAAVLSLALGIGANAALFSFVNAILLKNLPVPRPEQLYALKDNEWAALPFEEMQQLSRQASQLGTFLGSYPLDVSVGFGDRPEWTSAELVTGDYFRTVGIQPEHGRLLTERDLEAATGSPVCVISHRLWQTKFNGAPDIIGRTLLLNARPYKIIGVTAPNFHGVDLLRPSDIQIPVTRLPDYMPSFVSNPKFDWHSRLFILSRSCA